MFALSLITQMAAAVTADEVRGGWTATVDGVQHVYQFKIRGTQVTGVYCTDCSDATTLAFIEGTLGSDGITFVVNHVNNDGSRAYQDQATAKLEKDHLAISGRAGGPGGGKLEWSLHKDPRGPAAAGGLAVVAALPQLGTPAAAAAAYGTSGQTRPERPAGGAAPPAWQQPGPWELLTPQKLVGVWIAGTGVNKQYFIIRKVGNQLLGVVCGDCSNPYTMAALDGFEIDGDTLKFNIAHEDWGFGKIPFQNVLTVRVTKNEMRAISMVQDNLAAAPAAANFGMIGPLAIEATAAKH
jgi:hypothetical protein